MNRSTNFFIYLWCQQQICFTFIVILDKELIKKLRSGTQWIITAEPIPVVDHNVQLVVRYVLQGEVEGCFPDRVDSVEFGLSLSNEFFVQEDHRLRVCQLFWTFWRQSSATHYAYTNFLIDRQFSFNSRFSFFNICLQLTLYLLLVLKLTPIIYR